MKAPIRINKYRNPQSSEHIYEKTMECEFDRHFEIPKEDDLFYVQQLRMRPSLAMSISNMNDDLSRRECSHKERFYQDELKGEHSIIFWSL